MYTIHVEANNPPGKRCTLYLRYAEKIGQYLGMPFPAIFHSPHPVQGRIAPALLVKGIVLVPEIGEVLLPQDVCAALTDAPLELHEILSPQDICAGLTDAGLDWSAVPDMESRLGTIQEHFLEGI